jgi:hypothetical protein
MSLPFQPSKKSAKAVLAFYKQVTDVANDQSQLRDQFRNIDLSYLREGDWTEDTWKSHIAKKTYGDVTKFQNIILPLVMPQVESAVTYQQSVFLSGYPIFGATSSPLYADAATTMDTIIGEQQLKERWVHNLLRVLRNGFKYNFGPVEVDWVSRTSYALEDAQVGKEEDRQRKVIWQGNSIKALDPYNTFVDGRVCPTELPDKGEFAGYTEVMSRIAFKKFLAELPMRINAKEALESATGSAGNADSTNYQGYYIPDLDPEVVFGLKKSGYYGTNWLAWANLTDNNQHIQYRNVYEVTTLYGRILPIDFDFNVPARNTPQVWKFIIVNRQVLVYAERMTNVHNLIPVLIGRPVDDNLQYQAKSFARNVEPFQNVGTALINSVIHARRRAISDRMLYDPSRVSKGMIENDNPISKIPVRPSAFGTSMSEAVYQFPFRDEQSQHAMQQVGQITSMANMASGLNPARQGQFVKGNKTRHEFAEIMQYANGRDQTVALTLEGTLFMPMKEIIKNNILQYQPASSVFNREGESVVEVNPVELRKANIEFKISDGILPSEKIIDGESLAMAFQTLGQIPSLSQGYNLVPMFSYLMKTKGAKLQPFEKSPEQIAYEQAVGAWNQTAKEIVEMLTKEYGDQLPPMEEVAKALPPQPTPEQFGYNPKQPVRATDSETPMQQYTTITSNLQQAEQQAEQPAQSATNQGEVANAGGQ